MDWSIIKRDFQYVILNCFTNRIPCWMIRKLFYKLFGMKIEKKARIGLHTVVIAAQNIIIGQRSVINEYCYLDGSGKIIIGDNVSISSYAKIITSTHYVDSPFFEYCTNKICIENNVWVGACSIILDGSILKCKSVISSGCVFKNIAEENTVYFGNPAKLLKSRNLKNNYDIDYKPYFR